MNDRRRYLILEKTSMELLCSEVNSLMDEGYIPQGAPFALKISQHAPNIFCQALVYSPTVIKLSGDDRVMSVEDMTKHSVLFKEQRGTVGCVIQEHIEQRGYNHD